MTEDSYLLINEPFDDSMNELFEVDKNLGLVALMDIKENAMFENHWECVEKLESLIANNVRMPDAPKLIQYFSGSLRYTKNKRLLPYFRFRLENDHGGVLFKKEFFYYEKSLERDINDISKTKDFWIELYKNYNKEPENVKQALIEGDLDNIFKAQFDAFVSELQFVLTGHFSPMPVKLNLYYSTTKRNNIKIDGAIEIGRWKCNLAHMPLMPSLAYHRRSILVCSIDQDIVHSNCRIEQELERQRYINNERASREQEKREELEKKRKPKWDELKKHVKLMLLKLGIHDNQKSKIRVFSEFGCDICGITIKLIDHAIVYKRLSLDIRFDNYKYPDINIILIDENFPIHRNLRRETIDLFEKIEYMCMTILGEHGEIGIHTSSIKNHNVRILNTHINEISKYSKYNKIYIGCNYDGTTMYMCKIFS